MNLNKAKHKGKYSVQTLCPGRRAWSHPLPTYCRIVIEHFREDDKEDGDYLLFFTLVCDDEKCENLNIRSGMKAMKSDGPIPSQREILNHVKNQLLLMIYNSGDTKYCIPEDKIMSIYAVLSAAIDVDKWEVE